MEQIELVKILLKNTYINFLLGAGTSYNEVDGKMHFPLMRDLLNFIKKDVKVLEFYNSLKIDTHIPVGVGDMIASLYDDYLFSPDANIEKFLSVLEGVDLYIADIDFRNTVEEQRNYIRRLIRDRLNNSDKDTVINNYISFYNTLEN